MLGQTIKRDIRDTELADIINQRSLALAADSGVATPLMLERLCMAACGSLAIALGKDRAASLLREWADRIESGLFDAVETRLTIH